MSSTSHCGRIAIVGRPNVGKSTLLNALLGEPIAITSPHPQTTRETVRGVLTVADTQYVFVDTPGLQIDAPAGSPRRHAPGSAGAWSKPGARAHGAPRSRLGEWMNEAARQAAREADAVVLVVDGEPTPTDEALAAELPEKRTVLVINKVDRVKDKAQLLPLLASIGERHAFAAIVPMSAKRGVGTDGLLSELRALLPEQPFLYEPDTLSDQPVRFFVAEFVREQILAHTRQEVPHGVAVVVERFDESTDVPHIEIAVHVARESHKKILIGAGGQMLKRVGTAARARVEQMLGKQVHLRLWVRATPDWMNDPARLRELGYGGGAS